MVTTPVLLALGVAALCWPPAAPCGRAARVGRRRAPRVRRFGAGLRAASLLLSATAVVVAASLAGVVVGVAVAMVAATVRWLVDGALGRRRSLRVLVDLSGGLRLLGRELAAGSRVPAAVSVATEMDCTASDLLVSAAAGTHPGEPPDRAPGRVRSRGRRRDRDLVAVETRLRSAWRLSARYGIPLAGVVRALGDDIDDRREAMQRRVTATAGPTLSGYLLAGLPAAGLVLGTAMGARPLHVLTATSVGEMLLLAGTLLTCAGLLWSDRIARS